MAALSGVGGAQLRLFDSIDGDLILEKQLHNSRAGQLFSPQQLGVSISFLEGGDILALTNGHTLYRVHGTTGDIIWAWTSPDEAYVVSHNSIFIINFKSDPWSFMITSSYPGPQCTQLASQNPLHRTRSTSLRFPQKQASCYNPSTFLQALPMALPTSSLSHRLAKATFISCGWKKALSNMLSSLPKWPPNLHRYLAPITRK